MKAIPIRIITDSVLVSTNVAENDYAVWSASADYTAGDTRIVLATHTVYKCLSTHSHTVAAYPPDNTGGTTPIWYEVGKTSRWRMFDALVSSTTSNANSIEVVLDASMCDSIALFNCSGSSVYIKLVGSDGTTILFEETVELFYDDYVDWADIFFNEPSTVGNIFRTFPVTFGSRLYVNVYNSGGVATCGLCAVGRGKHIGKSRWGMNFSLKDYSKKSVNDYGEAYLDQGGYADVVTCDLTVPNTVRAQTKLFLTALRATGAVWVLDNQDGGFGPDMFVFGFYEDLQVVLSSLTKSDCSLKIQGLV